MAKSEIDDIFASKPTGKAPQPAASTSALPPAEPAKKKKKKDKKRKRAVEDEEPVAAPAAKAKRPVPETVLDPSLAKAGSEPPAKRAKAESAAARSGKAKVKTKSGKATDKDDEDRFKDSRGAGPRRKTEEGFTIYKEDELGIADEGGDTPLCPFDCQCCF